MEMERVSECTSVCPADARSLDRPLARSPARPLSLSCIQLHRTKSDRRRRLHRSACCSLVYHMMVVQRLSPTGSESNLQSNLKNRTATDAKVKPHSRHPSLYEVRGTL